MTSKPRLIGPDEVSSPGASDVGVEFTTMSKGYNMAGWRVGFCSGNREMIRAEFETTATGGHRALELASHSP